MRNESAESMFEYRLQQMAINNLATQYNERLAAELERLKAWAQENDTKIKTATIMLEMYPKHYIQTIRLLRTAFPGTSLSEAKTIVDFAGSL